MTLVQEAVNIMERLPIRNQQIVLELLRVMDSQSPYTAMPGRASDKTKRAAALGLAGLWMDHENGSSVEETVRDLRKGRRFDT